MPEPTPECPKCRGYGYHFDPEADERRTCLHCNGTGKDWAPTSARADRGRSPMSKTKARAQAHRESVMYRVPGEGWEVLGADFVIVSRQPFADARRALAAWRAERTRELMGEPPQSPPMPVAGSGCLASSLHQAARAVDAGHRVPRKPTLEELDRYER